MPLLQQDPFRPLFLYNEVYRQLDSNSLYRSKLNRGEIGPARNQAKAAPRRKAKVTIQANTNCNNKSHKHNGEEMNDLLRKALMNADFPTLAAPYESMKK